MTFSSSSTKMYSCNSNIVQYGTFGYNCGIEKCDFIVSPDYDDFPQTMYFTIGWLVPLILIVFSYVVIWIYVRKAAQYLRTNG
jgi:hypothetical protein